MKKIIITLAAMASASAFAIPDGYSYLTSLASTGEHIYINTPRSMSYRDGSKDVIYEFTVWSQKSGFETKVARCKTDGLTYTTSINKNGEPVTDRPFRYAPGTVGYSMWEFACRAGGAL